MIGEPPSLLLSFQVTVALLRVSSVISMGPSGTDGTATRNTGYFCVIMETESGMFQQIQTALMLKIIMKKVWEINKSFVHF